MSGTESSATDDGRVSRDDGDAITPDTRRNVGPAGMPIKIVMAVVVVILVIVGYYRYGDFLSLDYLAGRETELRELRAQRPIVAILLAITTYIIVAGLSLPGAAGLSLVIAWYFGFWQGLVVVSIGSTAGATVAFLLTRYLFRDWMQQKMAPRFAGIHDAFEREGAFYLFTLRLIPAVPFFVINAVMGLTHISAFTFWWVSQLGMLPGTAAYVYAGSRVPSLKILAEDGVGQILDWQLLIAFAIVGLLPLVIKRIMRRFDRSKLPSPAG